MNCTPKVGHPPPTHKVQFFYEQIYITLQNTKPYSTTCTYAANSVPQTTAAFPEPTCGDGYAPIRKAASAHSNIPNPKP